MAGNIEARESNTRLFLERPGALSELSGRRHYETRRLTGEPGLTHALEPTHDSPRGRRARQRRRSLAMQARQSDFRMPRQIPHIRSRKNVIDRLTWRVLPNPAERAEEIAFGTGKRLHRKRIESVATHVAKDMIDANKRLDRLHQKLLEEAGKRARNLVSRSPVLVGSRLLKFAGTHAAADSVASTFLGAIPFLQVGWNTIKAYAFDGRTEDIKVAGAMIPVNFMLNGLMVVTIPFTAGISASLAIPELVINYFVNKAVQKHTDAVNAHLLPLMDAILANPQPQNPEIAAARLGIARAVHEANRKHPEFMTELLAIEQRLDPRQRQRNPDLYNLDQDFKTRMNAIGIRLHEISQIQGWWSKQRAKREEKQLKQELDTLRNQKAQLIDIPHAEAQMIYDIWTEAFAIAQTQPSWQQKN